MKRILFVLLFVTGFVAMHAQITHTPNGAVDQNADKILKKAAQKFSGDAVSFNVTVISKDENKKESSRMKADVLYKGGKFRVSFDGNVIYCDGSSTWHWNKGTAEVTVNTISSNDDDLMNPGALLANYSRNYRAKFIRKEENGDAVIDLTPKKTKSYYKIRLIIASSTGLLKRMEMHNYDSSSSEYVVSSFKSGVKTTDADFVFPKAQHPEVEVIDMR